MKLPRCAGGNAEGKSRYELPLRVTCCARVSAEKGKKINSLENQIQYYKELIQSKPNGTYIEGYVEDTAILGLKSELQQQSVSLVQVFLCTEMEKNRCS